MVSFRSRHSVPDSYRQQSRCVSRCHVSDPISDTTSLPNIPTALAGIGDDEANAPGTSHLVVPPQIRDFNNPGLNLRQTYTVTMIEHHTGHSHDRDHHDDAENDGHAVHLTTIY